jgi:hypothetical protein
LLGTHVRHTLPKQGRPGEQTLVASVGDHPCACGVGIGGGGREKRGAVGPRMGWSRGWGDRERKLAGCQCTVPSHLQQALPLLRGRLWVQNCHQLVVEIIVCGAQQPVLGPGEGERHLAPSHHRPPNTVTARVFVNRCWRGGHQPSCASPTPPNQGRDHWRLQTTSNGVQ